MTAPQVIMAGLLFLGLGIELARDGKPKEGNYNFGTSLLSTAISFGLLWWGGFWK